MCDKKLVVLVIYDRKKIIEVKLMYDENYEWKINDDMYV